jgi:hypothetical protein
VAWPVRPGSIFARRYQLATPEEAPPCSHENSPAPLQHSPILRMVAGRIRSHCCGPYGLRPECHGRIEVARSMGENHRRGGTSNAPPTGGNVLGR